MSRKTGLVWHELYMWHNTGKYAGVMPPGLRVQPYEHSEPVSYTHLTLPTILLV